MNKILKKYREEVMVGKAYLDTWVPITYKPVERNRLEKLHYRLLKRSFDLLSASLLSLLILPWLIPIMAVIIKLDSKGPVFFIQKRTGRDRKSFYCIKFRSMRVNDEANRKRVTDKDERITRVGEFMRKYFVDEIPQLVNVVRGDMSMVGPRPFMLWDNVRDSKLIENYHDRHKVKPGLTGLAQMRGYHGMVNDQKDLYNRITSDLEYIANWSWYGDIFIIFGTIVHIIRGINA
ncbi:MAG: sugar transferase [Bacteroidales bacterium]|nr:sugar transferase [Bacteroidales bacterium]MCF8387216.1 sugar transferase [Bacteroidales bacterium]MCF8397864.1 sugar transferase [Bacteroidales bacterium]